MLGYDVLPVLARKAIRGIFFKDEVLDKEDLIKKYPFLTQTQATFVTLTLDGNLRGCIGSLIAHQSLLDDLLSNAVKAAFQDPRFQKLTIEEFEKIKVEVSVLTEPKPLKYKDFQDLKTKLIPNKHGVILELDGRRATFLPQVWEQLPTFDIFMSQLCKKAGLEPNSLSSFPKIQIYEAIKVKEE